MLFDPDLVPFVIVTVSKFIYYSIRIDVDEFLDVSVRQEFITCLDSV